MSFHYIWWPFLILVPFLVPETIWWLDKRPGNTFSEWLWDVFALRRGSNQKHARGRRMLFGAFWAALTGHFFLQTSALWLFALAAANIWSVVYHYENERKMVQSRRRRAKKP